MTIFSGKEKNIPETKKWMFHETKTSQRHKYIAQRLSSSTTDLKYMLYDGTTYFKPSLQSGYHLGTINKES